MGSKGSYLITLPRRGSGFVLRVDYARWGQTPEDLRHLALSAPHTRTRERALALFEITQGRCATRLAARTGRHPQTVMGWVHAYNDAAGELFEVSGAGLGVQDGAHQRLILEACDVPPSPTLS